jgi:thiamine kinase-like enzyme
MDAVPQTDVITSIEEITPNWLTAVLQRHNPHYPSVASVAIDAPRTTNFSIVVRLHLTYQHPTTAPRSLFLKFSQPTRSVGVPETGHEVTFYTHVAPALPNAPLVRCYDASFAPRLGKLHVLLEDLTETHVPEVPSHVPPSLPRCEQIVDALAHIHSLSWEKPPFALIGAQLLDAAAIAQRVETLTQRTHAFQTFLGDALSDERRALYRRVLNALPHLFQRLSVVRGMAIVHDDIHIGNFLYPHDAIQERLRMIDWQTWTIDVAAKDLAHMMAYFWFPERRARFEVRLLQFYHARLQHYGITSYAWEHLFNDYRFCVIRKLFHPAWQWESGDNASKWWFHLERITLAYHDLHCDELVEDTQA